MSDYVTCVCGKPITTLPQWLTSVNVTFICTNCPSQNEVKGITQAFAENMPPEGEEAKKDDAKKEEAKTATATAVAEPEKAEEEEQPKAAKKAPAKKAATKK